MAPFVASPDLRGWNCFVAPLIEAIRRPALPAAAAYDDDDDDDDDDNDTTTTTMMTTTMMMTTTTTTITTERWGTLQDAMWPSLRCIA